MNSNSRKKAHPKMQTSLDTNVLAGEGGNECQRFLFGCPPFQGTTRLVMTEDVVLQLFRTTQFCVNSRAPRAKYPREGMENLKYHRIVDTVKTNQTSGTISSRRFGHYHTSQAHLG